MLLNDNLFQEKIKFDTAGAHKFVFSDVVPGSRRGWNFIRDYNTRLELMELIKN
jgi:hypothetical protein